MRETLLPRVKFSIQSPPDDAPDSAPTILSFEIPLDLPGGLQASIERITIPFSPDAWANFRRAVRDGKSSPVTIARTVPGNGVRP